MYMATQRLLDHSYPAIKFRQDPICRYEILATLILRLLGSKCLFMSFLVSFRGCDPLNRE